MVDDGDTQPPVAIRPFHNEVGLRPFRDEGADETMIQALGAEVSSLNSDIEIIRLASSSIRDMNTAFVAAASSDLEKTLAKQAKPLIDDTLFSAKRAKRALAHLESRSTTTLDEKLVRSKVRRTMSGQFVVAVREYKKEQQRFLGAVQRKAGASIRRIKGVATDAEIDAILTGHGGGSERLFTNAVNSPVSLKGAAPATEDADETGSSASRGDQGSEVNDDRWEHSKQTASTKTRNGKGYIAQLQEDLDMSIFMTIQVMTDFELLNDADKSTTEMGALDELRALSQSIMPMGDEDYDCHDRPCSVEQCSLC